MGILEPLLRRLLPNALSNGALRRTALFLLVAIWVLLSTVAVGAGSDWFHDTEQSNFFGLAPHLALPWLVTDPNRWMSATGLLVVVQGVIGLVGLLIQARPRDNEIIVLSADKSRRDE